MRAQNMSDNRWPWHVAVGRIIIASTLLWGLIAFGIYRARGEELPKPAAVSQTSASQPPDDNQLLAVILANQRNESMGGVARCTLALTKLEMQNRDLQQKLDAALKTAAAPAPASDSKP